MKFKQSAITLAFTGMTFLAGCATTQQETIAKSKYDSDMAAKNVEIEKLRNRPAQVITQVSETKNDTRGNLNSALFPPNALPGHCYARALIPAEYKTIEEQVLVSDASESIRVIPAEFSAAQETILVREASAEVKTLPATYKTVTEEIVDTPETVRLVPVPATYKEVTEQILLKPASSKVISVPAEYETVTEQVLDKPAHTVWKKGAGFSGDAIKINVDQSTGEIMCLVEVPATYKTITKRVLRSPATTQTVEIPAEYETVTRTVVDRPATTREEIIPATYKTVTRQVIDTPASFVSSEIPAKYKTVNVTKLISPAQEVREVIPARYETVTKQSQISEEKLVWREVLCDVNVTNDLVTQLQRRLHDEGHYNNVIDGVWGPDTQRGIDSYASANGLTTGTNYIPVETAKALGMNF